MNSETVGKELKNSASERVIPIHPELFKAGFLEYVQKAKGGH